MAKKGAGRHCMIRLKGPGQAARMEDLLGGSYSFGRGDPEGKHHVDFALPNDPHLSRVHCRLDRKGASYSLENLSPNGTVVNGRQIEEPILLKHKDKIEIGSETVIDFLLLDDTERAKELHIAAAPAAEVKEDKKAKKSLLQSPWMWGVIAFYGLLAIVVASAIGGGGKRVTDPGSGPYFEPLITRNLEPGETSAASNELAARMWADAMQQHAGENIDRGPHAYYLVLRAQQVLALKGYGNLREAISRKDPIALKASDALSELEARISNLYLEAKQYRGGGHWDEARRRYERIRDAIPDRDVEVRRYAAYMAHRLSKLKD